MWRPAPPAPSVMAWIQRPLAKCSHFVTGKISLTFLGCFTMTPTPPMFRPFLVDGIAGRKTALLPFL
eukprot:7804595-Heterocapsa_arctica.AAC.1